jgi:hypothetical protein
MPILVKTHESATNALFRLEFDETKIKIWTKDSNAMITRTNSYIPNGNLIQAYHNYSYDDLFSDGAEQTYFVQGIEAGEHDIDVTYVLDNTDLWTNDFEILFWISPELYFKTDDMSSSKLIDPATVNSYKSIGVLQEDDVELDVEMEVELPAEYYIWSGMKSGTGKDINIYCWTSGLQTEQVEVAEMTNCFAKLFVFNLSVGEGEIAWCISHPVRSLTVDQLRDEAVLWAQVNLTGLGGGIHNGRADAARHAYWNAIMTLDWNSEDAQGLADAHERTGIFNGNPHNETVMDLNNNLTGRTIVENGATTRVQIETEIIQLLDLGDLLILDDLNNIGRAGMLQPSNK